MYKVAGASEYLVVTGAWIDDLKISKKAWILSGQSYKRIDLTPVNYTFNVQAMSAEKLPFGLPAIFTIGPRTEDSEALQKYSRLIAYHDKDSNHVKEVVQGIIKDETCFYQFPLGYLAEHQELSTMSFAHFPIQFLSKSIHKRATEVVTDLVRLRHSDV